MTMTARSGWKKSLPARQALEGLGVMTEYQSDVLQVAADLAKRGAMVTIGAHVFGFKIRLVPTSKGRFKAIF